ncbi:MAG: uroporphyrinogen-III C-methyltransferase [SAR324 cluster bacterium]|uniref:Uroporphyrinogen-III C-methyltransferase n=1 Tax=SAR324 cluster bacterium TaxID=2024889 RepID=A0A2A4TB23_9DELT|nr:MAG: uroporphyrinogen-III C-methyltransferase [SAR324 cluster bacterium]
MEYLPIFINLKDQLCVVVGGEKAASPKIALLLKAGAKVKVVALELSPAVAELVDQSNVIHQSAPFSPQDLDQCKLVIVAEDPSVSAKEVAKAAQERNIPVNVIDNTELCSFILPSIVDRSPVQVAISTGGTSPILARELRAKVEAMLPQSYGKLATLLGRFRSRSKELFQTSLERKKHWERIFSSRIIEDFLAGKEEQAQEALEQEFLSPQMSLSKQGQVCLVGAGPGDPDLLTIRALRQIQSADVIVYDRLVAPAILEYARRDAEMIYVGKKASQHVLPQEQINQILVDLAKEGKNVVRLKGGDPFIFGRGGEELEMLIQAGVDFQVVPGVTAASGCGTYAGIPLTHRDYAQSCVMVTGHLKKGELDLNWQSLVQPMQTLVFYMGLSNISVLCRELQKHGMSPDMPAALVERGTTKNQRVFTGTIANLPQLVEETKVKPPTLVIIGNVVSLQKKLSWFHPTGD